MYNADALQLPLQNGDLLNSDLAHQLHTLREYKVWLQCCCMLCMQISMVLCMYDKFGLHFTSSECIIWVYCLQNLVILHTSSFYYQLVYSHIKKEMYAYYQLTKYVSHLYSGHCHYLCTCLITISLIFLQKRHLD